MCIRYDGLDLAKQSGVVDNLTIQNQPVPHLKHSRIRRKYTKKIGAREPRHQVVFNIQMDES